MIGLEAEPLPFCALAVQAVEVLRTKGYRATHPSEGVHDWRARGLPVENGNNLLRTGGEAEVVAFLMAAPCIAPGLARRRRMAITTWSEC